MQQRNSVGAAGRAYVSWLPDVEICKKYNDGQSMKSLAIEYGTSYYTIKNILKIHNIKIRSKIEADILRGKKERSGIIQKCLCCNKEFYAFKGYVEQGRSKFCSQKCHFEYVQNNVEFQCQECGKITILQQSEFDRRTGNFCSIKCYHKSRRSKIIDFTCQNCNKVFQAKSHVKRSKRIFCSLQCSQDYRSGENHHNWRGGITPLAHKIRKHPKYKRWAAAARKRDNYTCQDCGKTFIKYSKNLQVHHIEAFAQIIEIFKKEHNTNDEVELLKLSLKYDKLWNLDNAITLCVHCHKIIHTISK